MIASGAVNYTAAFHSSACRCFDACRSGSPQHSRNILRSRVKWRRRCRGVFCVFWLPGILEQLLSPLNWLNEPGCKFRLVLKFRGEDGGGGSMEKFSSYLLAPHPRFPAAAPPLSTHYTRDAMPSQFSFYLKGLILNTKELANFGVLSKGLCSI